LRGKNEGVRFRVSNGSAVKSSEDVTDSPKNKSKFKHKDRKNRSKSITAETRPGVVLFLLQNGLLMFLIVSSTSNEIL
jgi:hypothetical protein